MPRSFGAILIGLSLDHYWAIWFNQQCVKIWCNIELGIDFLLMWWFFTNINLDKWLFPDCVEQVHNAI